MPKIMHLFPFSTNNLQIEKHSLCSYFDSEVFYNSNNVYFILQTNGESNSVASSTETSAMTKSQSYLNNTSTPEVEIDLDEVLDLDNDVERRKFIKSQLSEAKKPQEVVNVSYY